MSLQDSMSIAADRARKSGKKIDKKAIKARAERSARKMNAEMALENVAKAAAKAGPALEMITTKNKPKAAPKPDKPVKITVKRMVLDLFYAVEGTVFSTPDAVTAIQKKHAGTNESSIRVWITDLQADGSLKQAGREGRKVLLKSGTPGKFAKRGN